jgi:hypothetical protein
LITQPPHDEVGRYEVQCSVGQKRDESAGPVYSRLRSSSGSGD